MTADPTTTLAAEAVRHEPVGELSYCGPPVEPGDPFDPTLDRYGVTCLCGEFYTTDPDDDLPRMDSVASAARLHLAAHLLAVLAEEGWAVVKLPEADETYRTGLMKWRFGEVLEGFGPRRSVAFVPEQLPDHGISYNGFQFHTPQTARAAAAALLAAARAAEGGDL